jgi:hypothetical protein
MVFDKLNRLHPRTRLLLVPTFSRAKALPVYPAEQAGQARASCARFSGPSILVGTRFSASVVFPYSTLAQRLARVGDASRHSWPVRWILQSH